MGLFACAGPVVSSPGDAAQIDADVLRLMEREHVAGLALAVVDDARVKRVVAYGMRDVADRLPLTTDTVMYGASFTKAVFAYFVLELAGDGRLDLDAPILGLLPKPLGDDPRFHDLADDARAARLTPRHVLTHASGLANFAELEPDRRLRFHFEPGSRYAYSGAAFNLLQFALETGLGIDVGSDIQARIFDRFGMTRTSLRWRDEFAANAANVHDSEGRAAPHPRRRSVRAAGSMDTTIADQARFWAAVMRGDGLSGAARQEWIRPQLAVRSARQFPTFDSPADVRGQRIGLAAGLGIVVFQERDGGAGWFKGGHDDGTANMAICQERGRRCLVMLANDVRAERIFAEVTSLVLGATAMPWWWEYGATAVVEDSR